MDNTFQRGDYLELELNDGSIYIGRFHSQKRDKSDILLYDVQMLPKGGQVDGKVRFYKAEIKNLKRISELETTNNASKRPQMVNTLSNEDVEELDLISKKFIFVNQIDNEFRRVLNDLNRHKTIAVGTEGSEMGRKCKLPLLTISTPRQIYIFDVQVMQKSCFDAGLKEILESNEIKKIIHNSRNLSDCLFHKHQVELNNVFDTQVADVIVYKNTFGDLPEKLRTLQECISSYLNISDVITEKVDIVEWSQRPLKISIKEMVSNNILYLHRLSETLEIEMMAPFTKGVSYFVDRLRRSNDYEAWKLSSQEKQLTEEFCRLLNCKTKD